QLHPGSLAAHPRGPAPHRPHPRLHGLHGGSPGRGGGAAGRAQAGSLAGVVAGGLLRPRHREGAQATEAIQSLEAQALDRRAAVAARDDDRKYGAYYPAGGIGGRWRRSLTTASSRTERKVERARLSMGFGPPVISPMARRCSIRARDAMALPMEASVKGRPVGPITVAPASRQRLASRS